MKQIAQTVFWIVVFFTFVPPPPDTSSPAGLSDRASIVQQIATTSPLASPSRMDEVTDTEQTPQPMFLDKFNAIRNEDLAYAVYYNNGRKFGESVDDGAANAKTSPSKRVRKRGRFYCRT